MIATSPITLTYTKTAGEFNPGLTLVTINKEFYRFNFVSIVSLGRLGSAAAISMVPTDERIVVIISKSSSDLTMYSGTITAAYTLLAK